MRSCGMAIFVWILAVWILAQQPDEPGHQASTVHTTAMNETLAAIPL